MSITLCPHCGELVNPSEEEIPVCPICHEKLVPMSVDHAVSGYPKESLQGPNPQTEARLLICPDCGHKVSRMAVSCPGCGRPMMVQQSSQRMTPISTVGCKKCGKPVVDKMLCQEHLHKHYRDYMLGWFGSAGLALIYYAISGTPFQLIWASISFPFGIYYATKM